jgi:molybdopterin molybdotransferase
LTLVGESAAGMGWSGRLEPGQALRIFTGAPVPDGADTVMVQEDVRADGALIHLTGDGPGGQGSHIRKAGSDFRDGQPMIRQGERITAAHIGLIAMGGHGNVAVHRPVRVAILSTGNELVVPGDAVGVDQIPASNGVMIAAHLAGLPVTVIDCGIIRDDMAAITEAIRRAAVQADIIVTIGGASVGDHDLVRPALLDAGATLDFWKIAMKPGKPLMAGILGNAVVVGLPGNPVSAFVTATLFLKPLIARMAGAGEALPVPVTLAVKEALPATGIRAEFLRGRRDGAQVIPVSSHDSGALLSLTQADVLILRPADAGPVALGEPVMCLGL